MTRRSCPSCAHYRHVDRDCPAYRRGHPDRDATAAWVDAHVDRLAGRVKLKADGCPGWKVKP